MLAQTTRSHARASTVAKAAESASSWLWTQPPLPPCHPLACPSAPDQADSADP